MLIHIYNLLNVVFGKLAGASVDGIVSDIAKKVDKLQRLRVRLLQRAAKAHDLAFALIEEAQDHSIQASRARVVAEKLSALLA